MNRCAEDSYPESKIEAFAGQWSPASRNNNKPNESPKFITLLLVPTPLAARYHNIHSASSSQLYKHYIYCQITMGKASSGDGNNSGKRTAQKHKFYKFGAGGGDKGNGNGGEKGNQDDQSNEGKEHPKVFPLDKYREKPLVRLVF